MRCDFCGDEIEGAPFQKDGMKFCSVECSDAMETGEPLPPSEDILDDAEEYDDDDYDDDDSDEEEDDFDDDYYNRDDGNI